MGEDSIRTRNRLSEARRLRSEFFRRLTSSTTAIRYFDSPSESLNDESATLHQMVAPSLSQKTTLDGTGGKATGQDLVRFQQADHGIAGMEKIRQSHVADFLRGVAENFAKTVVDPQEPASRRHMGDPHGHLVERASEQIDLFFFKFVALRSDLAQFLAQTLVFIFQFPDSVGMFSFRIQKRHNERFFRSKTFFLFHSADRTQP